MFTRSLYLVGMTGVGKSTVGRSLASQLNFPFHDADKAVESRAGVSIQDIFELDGEKRFRRLEANIIDELTQLRQIVVATGGGVILRLQNRRNLTRRGFVIYLSAPVETLVERIQSKAHRPLLQNGDTEETLSKMYQDRRTLYEEVADTTIQINEYESSSEVAKVIAEWYDNKV